VTGAGEPARVLALVDGEHYPPVLIDAIEHLRARGDDVVAAVMLGGGEKLRAPMALGDLPVHTGATQLDALREGLRATGPDLVVDVSDAPVVGVRERFALACVSLASGAAYAGGGFRFDALPAGRTGVPTIAVIGTGKRTGKTAVSAALARHAASRGMRPIIVAMGRGGPAEPVVMHGEIARPTVADLVALADAGQHAASDVYEDALVAGVTTVGARRAGAGLAGIPVHDTVARAIEAARAERPDLLILEGSGTAIPPFAAGATLLVAGGATPAREIEEALGPLRLLISDLVVVTMAEEPILSAETLSALNSTIGEFGVTSPVVSTVFRPIPLGDVAGKRVLLATTAPKGAGQVLRRHLETVHGPTVVGITHHLSDRTELTRDLARAEGTYEVLVTELKAAAIDVAARAALDAGADVVFFDNEPVSTGADLGAAFDGLISRALNGALEQEPR